MVDFCVVVVVVVVEVEVEVEVARIPRRKRKKKKKKKKKLHSTTSAPLPSFHSLSIFSSQLLQSSSSGVFPRKDGHGNSNSNSNLNSNSNPNGTGNENVPPELKTEKLKGPEKVPNWWCRRLSFLWRQWRPGYHDFNTFLSFCNFKNLSLTDCPKRHPSTLF